MGSKPGVPLQGGGAFLIKGLGATKGVSSLEPGCSQGCQWGGGVARDQRGVEDGVCRGRGVCPCPLHPHHPLSTSLQMTTGGLLSPVAEGVQPCCNVVWGSP